jgi:hypothetical protein
LISATLCKKATATFSLVVAFTTCFIFPAFGQAVPVVRFNEGLVLVTGLQTKTSTIDFTSITQEQWREMLRIYTQDAVVKKLDQSVAGAYTWHDETLSFKPSFPFVAGQRYHGVFVYEAFQKIIGSQEPLPKKLEITFSIPEKKLHQTFVEAVHPQAEVLPENMLRMYISFSGPMMPGEAYDHIALLREDGTPVEKAFLVIDQELWNPERKRFTLLFDPGRVKRGIQSNAELGAPLQAGHTYRLVIDSTWRDANGKSLANSYTKSFTVAPPVRTKLSMLQWTIIAPAAGSRDHLVISFDRPIDYALASTCITITSGKSGKVSGKTAFSDSNLWRFTPDKPWPEDRYFVEVDPRLEDVAGNNFNNAFDIDLSTESRVNSSEVVRSSFSTRASVE